MAVLTTGNTFSNGDQVTAGSLNNAVNDAEFADGAVDGISTQKSGSGAIIVKDLGISSGKIAIDAVGTDQLANDVVISTSGSITTTSGFTGSVTGNVTGNVTGSITGNVTGDVTGDVTGNLSGNVTGGTGSFTTLTASGDLTVDTSTLKVDSTNNRVGIGTTSPSNTLHVENTTSSGAYINYDGQSNTEFGLRIESNADGGDFESDFANGSTALLDLYANSASVSGGDILVARTQSATPVMLVKGNGNVGIGETSPSAPLTVTSTTGGVILPRMTTSNRTSISSPANGEMVYDTDLNKFYGYANGAWVALH